MINVHEETESNATLQVIHVCRNPKRESHVVQWNSRQSRKLQRGRKSTFPEGQKERNQGIHDDISVVEHSGVSLSPSQYHLPSICTWMRTHIYIYARSLIPTLSRLAPGELLMIRKCGTVFLNFSFYSSAPPCLVFIFLLCYQSQNIHILIRHHQRRSIFK